MGSTIVQGTTTNGRQRCEWRPYQLSLVDHLSPRIHVPKFLFFSSKERPETIINALQIALEKTIEALPILGGSVGLLNGAPRKGTLAVQAPFFTASDVLSTNDFRGQYSFADYSSKNFSPEVFDSNLFSPDLASKTSRVLLAQVNIIDDGFVLAVVVHHCVVDETGIFNILKLWSHFCLEEDATSLVTPEWTESSILMSGEGLGRLEDHPEYQLRSPEESATMTDTGSTYISQAADDTASAVLFFSDDSLARLKGDATDPQRESWISTNDALCALIWSCVTRARRSAGMEDIPYSMFNMTVNGRSRLEPPVSSDYIGNVVFVSKAFLTLDNLASESPNLRSIAATVRESVSVIDDKIIKDKIQAISKVDDIGRLCPRGYNSFGRHLGCTSWSKQPYYALNWGQTCGGKCRRVRWRKNISDGIFVIFPKLPSGREDLFGSGGLEVFLGLKRRALDFLLKDPLFKEYGDARSG